MKRKAMKHLFISEQLKQAGFDQELTEKITDLLYKYKSTFETEKETRGTIIGHEVDIIPNVERLPPPLLRRTAYLASPRAKEGLEVLIKESIDLGDLRKLGHN
ncbi:hypothetical protein O181_083291 [Austropuccinia psidii MF-1]|uniref:Uncharacterized protein n=1 Tax=Austropuccinia psidii MF-1 TaxID=1389203 RepID=A0A9Q3FUA2_9BASI|nr:hypothetical protein [Austropuccinia psidii MF-1]